MIKDCPSSILIFSVEKTFEMLRDPFFVFKALTLVKAPSLFSKPITICTSLFFPPLTDIFELIEYSPGEGGVNFKDPA